MYILVYRFFLNIFISHPLHKKKYATGKFCLLSPLSYCREQSNISLHGLPLNTTLFIILAITFFIFARDQEFSKGKINLSDSADKLDNFVGFEQFRCKRIVTVKRTFFKYFSKPGFHGRQYKGLTYFVPETKGNILVLWYFLNSHKKRHNCIKLSFGSKVPKF